jgi:hypothetical protein
MSENTALTTTVDSKIIEQVMIAGDLSQLNADQKVSYYRSVCDSMGLNPLTQPFAYIKLNGKLTLYAKRDAADQLRKIHGISIDKPEVEITDGLVIVTVTGHDKTGRADSDLGVVSIGNLQGEQKANAILKAITKGKRRLTLSIVGLGWLDETEVETIPNAETIEPDEIIEPNNTSHKWTKQECDHLFLWAKERTLSGEQIITALGVSRLSEYTGDMAAAKARINEWLGEQDAEPITFDEAVADLYGTDVPAGAS